MSFNPLREGDAAKSQFLKRDPRNTRFESRTVPLTDQPLEDNDKQVQS